MPCKGAVITHAKDVSYTGVETFLICLIMRLFVCAHCFRKLLASVSCSDKAGELKGCVLTLALFSSNKHFKQIPYSFCCINMAVSLLSLAKNPHDEAKQEKIFNSWLIRNTVFCFFFFWKTLYIWLQRANSLPMNWKEQRVSTVSECWFEFNLTVNSGL